eukprot:scaffold71451_cov34-Prasinocladus_malaysianus.AAC.3
MFCARSDRTQLTQLWTLVLWRFMLVKDDTTEHSALAAVLPMECCSAGRTGRFLIQWHYKKCAVCPKWYPMRCHGSLCLRHGPGGKAGRPACLGVIAASNIGLLPTT